MERTCIVCDTAPSSVPSNAATSAWSAKETRILEGGALLK